ncbi:unnamed protein product [Diabrotica balteata]|uniref:Uncharacterized protein n=1 Tax=Diabrotica balteata TaxID=107213 RepID=A0A9N9XD33_DIABA|nr:unnamed protein product [Diabrotica balteata]
MAPTNICASTPQRLCKTRYNTTAPMYGVSLTSGQPVTIVQKFPDLLQQVVFESSIGSEFSDFNSDDDLNDKDYSVTESDCSTEGVTHYIGKFIIRPWCNAELIVPVKENYYRRVFRSQYNIGYKLPKTDKCQTCESYNVSLKSNKENAEECQQIKCYDNTTKVCESSECDVVRGECTQTYVPYLFLVIPLGPVTLTGQDYVLVESGCVCRPKYAGQHSETNAPIIPRI